ncbi:MAG: right-handed parallel beta-helix repeat-containing protein, partial [Elusimicrobia bacterium]|nr:right-handed parallel beta-helix repeat-containing protein [Elusimicrobiota bacterium]
MSRGSRCAGPLALAAIVAVGWLAWSNTLQNGFVYDDEIIIVKNAAIRSLSPLSKFLRPDAQYDGALESRHTWRPLSVLSHAVIYRWAGLDPRAYHLSNVLLHVANALLAYALILVLFRSRTTALVAALVFLLHPGQTEAVAWASAQSNLLYVFFYLSASILFVRSEGRVWSPAFALSLACFGLSLLSKESAVSLPLALGLCLVMARVSGKDGKQAGLASLVPYIVLAGVYVLARSLTLGKTAQTGYWAGGLLPQMLTMAKGFATYVRIAVWPDPLTLEYLFPVKRALDAETLGCGILLAGLACLGWRCLRRQPQAGFGILFFFLALAPVSNVIPINTVINERYLYLPLLGYGLVLGALLERGLKAGLPAFAALCGLFVILTASRNLDWKDNRTLIGETLKICPQASRLHSGMADALSQDGRFKEAVKEYRLALAIEVFNDPLLRTIDRFDPWEPGVLSKVAEYRKSLQLAVKRDKTLSNIGAALMRLGEHRKAARYLEEAVRLGASGQDTRTNLAVAHAQEGELSRAVVELEVLLKEYPGDRKALHNLALFREARVASFIPRLKQEFPSLKSKWESLSRLGYEETPGGLRPSLLGPVQGLKPEERQALAALAVREGRVLNDGSVLPKRYGEAYSVRFGDSAVRIRPIGGFAAESRVVDGVVLYPDAYQETSVFLAASGSSVEEFYYLKTPEAPRRFVQEFEGEGRIRSFSLTAEGNVAALNAVGAKVLELSKPVVIDSAGRKRGGVFSLKRAGAKTLLALAFDDRGLEFPVVIDPTWTTAGASQMTSARYAHSATLLPSGKVLVAGGFGGGYLPTAELYDPVAGTWTTTGSMPVARYKHTATLLPNGKVLVVGGSNGGGYLSTAALYDPATGTWATTSSMSTARESHVAALLSDGQVLVAGGFITGPGYLSTAEVYDPFAGTWTTTGSMVEARAEHAATLLRNGKLLAAGGYNGNCLSTAELYDPVAGTWTTTGSMAGVRREQIATLLPNGKVLAAGGTNAGGGSLSTAELYDPVAGTWTMTGAMVSARGYHVAALLPGGKVLVAGGYSGGYLSTAELYDPVAGTWTTIGSLSNGSEYHTATLLPNGKVLVAGGLTVGSLALSTAQLYAPALGSWASTGNMVSTRREHAAALLPNGKVLVAGGNNCLGCYFATAELYAPVVGAWAATGGMTAARDRLTVTLLPNGKVLAAGGSTGSFHSSAELYDPAAGTWAPTGSMPSVRIEHTATLLPNGKVLVAAGWNGDYVSTAVLYDPNAGSWAPTGSLAEPRYGHTATLLPNGKVLVAGGNWSSGNTAELYDPVTGSWAPTGSMNSVRRWHTATLLSNGKVLVAGGGYSTSISGAEVYDPAAGTWTPTGSMTSARRFHSAVLLPDGKVLAAGGFDGGTLSAMELYDPAAGTWAAAGSMVWPRSLYTATLLPDGKVLAAAGSSASPYSSTAELVQYTEYDFDLSTKTFMRPGIATVNGIGSFPVTLNPGNVYTVTGTTFTGVAEAAGSGRSGGDSTANHPRVYLMPQGSGGYGPGLPQGGLVDLSTSVYGNQEQTYYQQGKSSTTLDFTVPAGLACGYYNLHVMSNAILSTGAAVRIVPPVPTIAPSAASPGFLSVGLSSVAVQWTPTAESGVTGYIVQTALDAGFTNIVSTGFTTQALVPAATVYGLVPNTTYYFRAAAENCGGYGPFSGSLGSTSTLVAQPGTAISTFSAVRFGRMSVSWTANGNLVDATTYTVVLTTGASFPNAYDGNVSLSTLPAGVSLSATVTGLAPDALYFLHVAAVNHNGVASPYIALASTRTLGGPGCGPNSTVVQQDGYGDSTTIQGGVNLLPQTLTSDACVMIRDLGTYSEQVAVQSFTTSGYRLKIMTDPGFGPERAKVTPPALQGAFIVRNASVTIQGIDVVSANSTPYGIYASSSFVTISSVGVKGGSFISSAGIMLSSNSRVEFTSVTVQDAHGIAVMGSTSTIAMSTMTNSALTSYALFLMDGSSNSVSASYVANALGSGASIRSSHRNTVSLSTVTGSGSTGAFYINGGLSSAGASSNTVSECYVFGPASHGMYIDGRGGGSSNQVVKSTVVGNGAANVGMYVYWTFGNVVSGSRISNPTGGGVEITVSAHHNNFSSCTAISGGGYSAMSFYMASSNTVSGSYLLASSGKALSIRTTSKSNEIRESTLESSGPIDPALYLYDDAQSNTITNSFISNTGGGRAVDVALNSHHNTISLSTVTNNSASYPAVWVTNAGASSNTISECSIHNPSGIAAKLGTSAQFNIVEKSTISSNAAGAGGLAALDLDGASWNEVRRNRLQSASSKALALRGNATGNTVRLNTISGGLVDGSAVYLNAALSNLLDEDKITNVVGIGILLETGSRFNEVRNSTVTAAGDAFFAQSSSSNTIFGSYLEGGNAARVADSSGTRIYSSYLVSAANGGGGLLYEGGSLNLEVSSSTLIGRQGYGFMMGSGSGGRVVLSTNTIEGLTHGVEIIGPHRSGTEIWLASNTVVSDVWGSGSVYGVYLEGLTSGATVYNNSIVRRTPGGAAGYTAYGIYALNSPKLRVANNRISNPGLAANGSFVGAHFEASADAEFVFNDVSSSGTALAGSSLLRFVNSTGGKVRNNILFSSVTVSGSSSTLSVNAVSQGGFISDYNDFFCANGPCITDWGGLRYGGLGAWQTVAGQDSHSRAKDPLWFSPGTGSEDFHPLSAGGRWNPATQGWQIDAVVSRTIDGGDPADPFGDEPAPNGGRVNLGSYGNTLEASKYAPWTYDRHLVILPGEVYDPGSVTGRSGTPRKAYAQQRFSVEVRGTDDLWETDVNAVDNARLSLVPSMASNLPQTLAMSGGVRTFPNLYISDPGVGVVLKATHPTNGAIFAGYSSG